MIHTVTANGTVIAIIVKDSFSGQGIHFLTPNEFSQQLAYMSHPAGKVIETHVHNPVPREVSYTLEVLFLKRGKLRVDLYDDQRQYVESYILEGGDIIFLASGGHGFEVLEEIEMVEVKQGPYPGHIDKTRFEGVPEDQIKVID